MRNENHYTDEDFQDYFDKTFAGNVAGLETHVKECERCSKQFQAYSHVWLFASKDLKVEPLKIDLAYSVADKVFSKKESYVFDKVMYGILICLEVICLIVCIKFLLFYIIPYSFILLMIPVAGFLLLSYKETVILKKKYKSFS